MKPLYTKEDLEGISDSLPGEFPFTRGPYASMYTNKPWTIRQVAKYDKVKCSCLSMLDLVRLRRVMHSIGETWHQVSKDLV